MFSIEPTAPSLYSTKLNKDWSINYLSTVFQNPFVSIGFKAGINGIYTIHASELSSFSSNSYFYLKDLTSNFIMDLNQNDTYTFFASINDNENRFQIIFAASPLDIFDNKVKNTNIYSYKNFIYVNSNEVIQQINIYNIQGKLIKTINNITRNFVTDMNETDAGYYIVRVTTSKNIYSEKVSLK